MPKKSTIIPFRFLLALIINNNKRPLFLFPLVKVVSFHGNAGPALNSFAGHKNGEGHASEILELCALHVTSGVYNLYLGIVVMCLVLSSLLCSWS
jgi:hypothetical protein